MPSQLFSFHKKHERTFLLNRTVPLPGCLTLLEGIPEHVLYCSGIPVRLQTAVKGGSDGSGISNHPEWDTHLLAGPQIELRNRLLGMLNLFGRLVVKPSRVEILAAGAVGPPDFLRLRFDAPGPSSAPGWCSSTDAGQARVLSPSRRYRAGPDR